MRTLLTISLLALSAVCTQADLAVWNFKGATETDTGDGQSTKTKYNGYLVVNMDSGQSQLLTAAPSKSIYYVHSNSLSFSTNLTTGLNKYTQAVLISESPTNGGILFKGTAVLVNLGTTNSYWAAKVLTMEGYAVGEAPAGPLLEEYSGTAQLDHADSETANTSLQGNIGAVMGVLESRLQSQGYSRQ